MIFLIRQTIYQSRTTPMCASAAAVVPSRIHASFHVVSSLYIGVSLNICVYIHRTQSLTKEVQRPPWRRSIKWGWILTIRLDHAPHWPHWIKLLLEELRREAKRVRALPGINDGGKVDGRSQVLRKKCVSGKMKKKKIALKRKDNDLCDKLPLSTFPPNYSAIYTPLCSISLLTI